jgi:hypothetical protein
MPRHENYRVKHWKILPRVGCEDAKSSSAKQCGYNVQLQQDQQPLIIG